jgi:hypothetical protein
MSDARAEAREQIARALYEKGAYCGVCDFDGFDTCSECRATVRGYASTVLAVPAVAEALAAVERVRALAEHYERATLANRWVRVGELRRALDGPT